MTGNFSVQIHKKHTGRVTGIRALWRKVAGTTQREMTAKVLRPEPFFKTLMRLLHAIMELNTGVQEKEQRLVAVRKRLSNTRGQRQRMGKQIWGRLKSIYQMPNKM